MKEPSINHITEASEFSDGDRRENDAAGLVGALTARGITWQTAMRCLLLLAIMGMVGAMAWRPGQLRFSLLTSLVSPSRGDSLAWRPEEDAAPGLPRRKQTPSPAEWRLSNNQAGVWACQASGGETPAHWQGGSLSAAAWKRVSESPWNWQDDAHYALRRRNDPQAQPAQKPATGFRADDADDWGAIRIPRPTPEKPAERPTTTRPELTPLPAIEIPVRERPQEQPAVGIPAIGRSTPEAATPQTPVTPPAAPTPPALPARSDAAVSPGLVSLEPLNLDALNTPPQTPATPAATAPVASPTPRQPLPERPAAPEATEPANIDWKNREITERIPGAFLTVYPKLKFVGLCVPGQGYIRKYNQIGVPRDLETKPKLAADDGRTPYGKYYVAGRVRDGDGAKLLLSWPSPDDVRRLGSDEDAVTAVEMAWLDRIMPPQTTQAGGGLALTGGRQWQDATEGGFSLEEPHIEEVYTALPDGAWVFIQE